jgi:hypothetical protein
VDESRQRENAIDRELTRAFRAEPASGAVGDHLDGEVAAAWMEQGLDAGARARVEVHLADCAQCQALIATLSRISPPGREAAGDSWWQWLRTPWLVPAAAATIAAAVWVALPSQNQSAAPESVQARLEERSSSAPPSAPAPATLAAPAAAPPPAPSEARPAPEPGGSGARRAAKAEQDSPESKASDSKASESTEFARVAPPSPVQDRQTSSAAQARATPPRERQEVADTFAGAAAAPAAPPPAPAAAANEALSQGAAGTAAEARGDRAQARSAFATAPRLLVMTADGTGRWRIAGGRIQYAAGNGAPWISAAALDTSGLTAGAAPGGLVCWFVGRAGTVLVTTDAVRFSRVAAPAASDLIAVRATDGRTATVTAADGRRFSTTDQGVSWTLVTR